MWYAKELEKYPKELKIGRHLLTFLLKEDNYNDFTKLVIKDKYYSLFGNSFYDIFNVNWRDYIISRTYSYILSLYHELGHSMNESRLFQGLELHYITHNNRTLIDGIILTEKRDNFIKRWVDFIAVPKHAEILKKLPTISMTQINHTNNLLICIPYFNNYLAIGYKE